MSVEIREITDGDLDAVTALLSEGFPAKDRDYWQTSIAALQQRPPVEPYPRFGYVLIGDGAPRGDYAGALPLEEIARDGAGRLFRLGNARAAHRQSRRLDALADAKRHCRSAYRCTLRQDPIGRQIVPRLECPLLQG